VWKVTGGTQGAFQANLDIPDILGVCLWHMLVHGRQLQALWVLSRPSSGMADQLGNTVGQTRFIFTITAHVGEWQAAGGALAVL
jgi:hypothetical protein